MLTDAGQLRRSAAILWFVQGDAAAKDEDDGVLHGSGGVRAREGCERRKTKERGENENRPFVTIYKEKTNKWARKMRRPKHGYPVVRAPQFSGRLLR